MRRWKQRYEAHGYDGLFDRRTKKPSPKKVPLADVEKVLRLYRVRDFDLNVRQLLPMGSLGNGNYHVLRRPNHDDLYAATAAFSRIPHAIYGWDFRLWRR